jgi:tyrosyl-tRNA synthetase
MLKGAKFNLFSHSKNTKNTLINKFSNYNFSQRQNENVFSYLNERNLVANISNKELLNDPELYNNFMKNNPRMYIGFDPTAESLHLGNLIGIITAIRFGVYGIEPVLLIGGATGQIGDPSGKNKERPLLEKERIEKNIEGINENFANVFASMEKFADFKKFCDARGYSPATNINHKTIHSSGSDDDEKLIEVKLKKVNEDFKKLERELQNPFDINYNNLIKTFELANKTKNNKSQILKSELISNSFAYKLINNNEFYQDLNIIDFLREVGTNLRMGPLLSRETVKNRLNTKEGISLTEFMYQTFQGYDYMKLFEKYNVKLQIGGSDQWGNMLAGYELIKKVKNHEVVNMTFPLMTTANGQKFGKSEGNALFINPKLTPVNNIYQYFYNSPDADLQKLFYSFTFLEKDEIDDIINSHYKKPECREGQKLLAEKIIGLLFSEDEAVKCKKNAEIHYKNFSSVNLSLAEQCSTENLESFFKDCNVVELSEECLNKFSVSTLCVEQKIFNTKSQCKRLIQSGSVLINNSKISDDVTINKSMLIGGKFLVLKTGKKHTHVFQVKSSQSNLEDTELDPCKIILNKVKDVSRI